MSVLFRRNATTDTQTVLLGTSSNANYVFAAESGSTSTTTAVLTGGGVQSYRLNQADLIHPVNRGTLWTGAFSNTTLRAVGFRNIAYSSGLRPGRYGVSDWNLEGEILGIALFTDWNQSDLVETYLISQV